MPENLEIGVFVFGAILVLIAPIGGNFKFSGAEAKEGGSSFPLRS